MGNLNKAEKLLENQSFKLLRSVELEQRNLKTSDQPVGGDIVDYDGSNLSAVDFVISAGQNKRITGIITPVIPKVVNWEVFTATFIDNDLNINYLYPSGSSISAIQSKFPIRIWWDYTLSDDETGVRVHHIDIKNDDSISHHIYMYLRSYGPKLQTP